MQKRTVKILTRIAIVIVVLGLIYAIAVSVSSSKLRQAYADLKKDGRPMEPSDVIPPEVPDTENAALLYESATLLLKAQPAAGENLLEDLGDLSDKFIKESLDSDKLDEFKELIGQDVVTQALSIVAQGTRRDSCRFDLNYDDGLNMLLPMLLPHLSELRSLNRILCAKVHLEAEAGNPDTAWDMVTTQLKFADALRTEPALISKLRLMAMIRLSCDTIKKLCETAPPNVKQSGDIQNLLKNLDDIQPLIHSVDAERLLIGEWVFNLTKDEMYKASRQHGPSRGDTGVLHKLIIFGITFKPLLLADHAAYLRFMHDGTRFLERPYSPEQGKVMEQGGQKTRYLVTRILTPAIFRVKEIHCEMIAQLRIVQAGLALLQHKQTENTFPATLETLKLQNINDPFSDGLLVYKTGGQNFILYSIGADQKDNGGSPRQKKQKTDWDIVWIFPGRQQNDA